MSQWSPEKLSELGRPFDIHPSRVLYEFDGPLIFVVDDAFSSHLFYKLDETSEGDSFFLVTSTNDKIVDALLKGHLSVRGALLEGSHYRVIKASADMAALSYCDCDLSDISDELLPVAGVGIHYSFPHAPDSLRQTTSFFSVRLSGDALHKGTMSFGTYTAFISHIYETFKRILAPSNPTTKFFSVDYPVYEPAFGSVIVAIDEPIVKPRGKKLGTEEAAKAYRLITDEIRQNRTVFLRDAEKVLALAQRGDLSVTVARENFEFLTQIKDLIPSDETNAGIGSLEFNAVEKSNVLSLQISEEVGSRLRRAYKVAERRPKTYRGKIVETNSRSGTFIVKTRDREITCVFEPEISVAIGENWDTYRIGVRVEIKGLVERRPRRDKMFVEELPTILTA